MQSTAAALWCSGPRSVERQIAASHQQPCGCAPAGVPASTQAIRGCAGVHSDIGPCDVLSSLKHASECSSWQDAMQHHVLM